MVGTEPGFLWIQGHWADHQTTKMDSVNNLKLDKHASLVIIKGFPIGLVVSD
jgi:hypothetical protein